MALTHEELLTHSESDNRIYMDLTSVIRLCSFDSRQVVLENLRPVKIKNSKNGYENLWCLVGYFPHESFFINCVKTYSNVYKNYCRKINLPPAIEHAMERYKEVWQYLTNTDMRAISDFIQKAKAHEHEKVKEQHIENRIHKKQKDKRGSL